MEIVKIWRSEELTGKSGNVAVIGDVLATDFFTTAKQKVIISTSRGQLIVFYQQ